MATHLLTGATSGIGHEVATRLRDRGDELVLLVRDPARAADLPDARLLVADLADPASISGLELPERLDSVVHAAGVVDLGPVADLDEATWRAHLDVNLLAPALLTRACLPALRAAQGTVVFVNSGAGLRANRHWSAYAASKFGLRALADALRAEEPDLRVSTVFPGRTATPMQQHVHAQEGREYDAADWIRPETVADAILGLLDLPRDATVPELVVRPTS
jgi:NAD(P)-dependent dehydrogenase (short-subunit alcohol dehydrogenase family)